MPPVLGKPVDEFPSTQQVEERSEPLCFGDSVALFGCPESDSDNVSDTLIVKKRRETELARQMLQRAKWKRN